MKKSIVKKAQMGKSVKPTADSTKYYTNKMLSNMDMAMRSTGELKSRFNKKTDEASKSLSRQSKKGKPGYDANGFPLKKKNGGMIKAKKK
jgi:hypothetical protein